MELDSLVVEVTHPGSRPLAPIVPNTVPQPTTDEYIGDYLQYLIGDKVSDYEQYTYGQRIASQFWRITSKYKKSFSLHHGYNTNQCSVSISMPSDVFLEDPPCLRVLDTKIIKKTLVFYVYFRSWDLWGGFPTNLGGIRLLQEAMAEDIGNGVEAGMIIAFCKGAHLYSHAWKSARILTGENG